MKLVIFDFDGTLADTSKLIVSCKQETMKRMGLEVMDEEVCRSTIGLSAEIGFRQTYPGLSDDLSSGLGIRMIVGLAKNVNYVPAMGLNNLMLTL